MCSAASKFVLTAQPALSFCSSPRPLLRACPCSLGGGILCFGLALVGVVFCFAHVWGGIMFRPRSRRRSIRRSCPLRPPRMGARLRGPRCRRPCVPIPSRHACVLGVRPNHALHVLSCPAQAARWNFPVEFRHCEIYVSTHLQLPPNVVRLAHDELVWRLVQSNIYASVEVPP